MRLRVALLAIVLLSGCVQRDDAPSASLEAANKSPSVPTERPDGRDGGFAAFNETNRTEAGTGGLDHAHDYWEGRERVTIYEGDVGLVSCCYTTTPQAYSRIPVPADALIFEGTGQVEVTLSKPERRACTNLYVSGVRTCSDAGTGQRAPDPTDAPGVHVLVRDAAMKDFADAGEVVWGTPIVVPIEDARQTDMPHSLFTLWGFAARSDEVADDSLFFHAKIDIVRAPESAIPQWPGHPEFYAESSVRVVLHAQAKTRENGPMYFVDPAAAEPQMALADKLVSNGTRTLRVFANVTEVKPDNPALVPTGWELEWHNASGRYRSALSAAEGGAAKEHVWTLPVDDAGMDSPYAEASRWGFRLVGVFEVGAADQSILGCYGLCASYEVSYALTVLATNEQLPEADYSVKP